jgi:uncharacterized protein YbjT (DUF2867 family)
MAAVRRGWQCVESEETTERQRGPIWIGGPMPSRSRTILITGATGKQGGAVLKHLRERGFSIRALTRDPSKPEARALVGSGSEVVHGDMEDFDSLRNAFNDVYGVFAMATPYEKGVESEIRQGNAMIDAARRAGVSHFVYSSVASADRGTRIPHFDSKSEIEKHLRASGLQYTILRPVFFMDNWERLRPQIEQGVFAQPLRPDTRLQMIAVTDIAAFVALAFEHPGKWRSREVDIAGEELSMKETAEVFGRVLDRPVRYEQVPWDEFERTSGQEMTVMYRWFDEKGYEADIPALRSEHHGLTKLERWLRVHGWDKVPVGS